MGSSLSSMKECLTVARSCRQNPPDSCTCVWSMRHPFLHLYQRVWSCLIIHGANVVQNPAFHWLVQNSLWDRHKISGIQGKCKCYPCVWWTEARGEGTSQEIQMGGWWTTDWGREPSPGIRVRLFHSLLAQPLPAVRAVQQTVSGLWKNMAIPLSTKAQNALQLAQNALKI